MPTPIVVREWGGLIIGRPDEPGITSDRDTIVAAGFTIVDEDVSAGKTEFWVYSSIKALMKFLRDPSQEAHKKLPGFFFQMARGAPLDASTVKAWTDNHDGVLFA